MNVGLDKTLINVSGGFKRDPRNFMAHQHIEYTHIYTEVCLDEKMLFLGTRASNTPTTT